MSIILGLIGVFALVALVTVLGGWAFGVGSRPKPELITKQDLRALRERDRIAERALQEIAGNLAGNTVATAQAALDQRAATHNSKELN